MRILYIDIDSLRPDHLGCYGYGRNTSPNIDRIASEGLTFENCYASDVPCLPSRTSLFSGRLGIHHGCVAHNGTRSEPFSEGTARGFRTEWAKTSWMRTLQDSGMRTVTFSSFGERHSAWHWYAGFDEIHDPHGNGHEISDAAMPKILDWMKRNGNEDNWFAHVNFWDVHVPYRTPEEFGNPFRSKPLPDEWLTDEKIRTHNEQPGIRTPKVNNIIWYADKRPDLNPAAIENTKDFKLIMDSYDTAILYADQQIGRIVSVLEKQGVLDDTAIIISADHGECFGELNAYGGHCFADNCIANIPLIIKWPGQERKGKNAGLIYNIDLASTVNQLLDIDSPEVWDSQSFTPVFSGNNAGRENLVLSQLAQTCQRSVRLNNDGTEYLYIRTYRNGNYNIPGEMLFNLSEDPHEQNDIAQAQTELTRKAAVVLDNWEKEQPGPNGDPKEAVFSEQEYC